MPTERLCVTLGVLTSKWEQQYRHASPGNSTGCPGHAFDCSSGVRKCFVWWKFIVKIFCVLWRKFRFMNMLIESVPIKCLLTALIFINILQILLLRNSKNIYWTFNELFNLDKELLAMISSLLFQEHITYKWMEWPMDIKNTNQRTNTVIKIVKKTNTTRINIVTRTRTSIGRRIRKGASTAQALHRR